MKTARGFSLVEMLAYLFILTLLSLVLVNVLVLIINSFTAAQAARNLNQTATVALGRMMQEIRQAKSATVPSANQLSLTTTDSAGDPITVSFSVAGGVLNLQTGAGAAVALTTGHSQVSALTFTKITTANSEAVRVQLTLTDDRGQSPPTINFYTTAVLRGSY
ncbi:MAG: prepilin-type N-terminal cleavage/methylation domain-containing protein [Candidatus Vogelbacteria bacterium]|nr:prepilin-type N-terminal cleavage/methylation domain-containing protein [Candidatus Vogelbacteria bacterium]